MNDDFLHRLREAPRPAFLRELRGKLDRIEAEERTAVRPAPARSLRPLFAGILIGASALALSLLTIDGHLTAPQTVPRTAAEAPVHDSVVALPSGNPAVTQATPAEYGVGVLGQAGAPRTYVLLAETRAMDAFVRDPVERFASNGRYFGTAGAPKTVVDTPSGVFSQFCSGAGLSSPDVVYSEHRISEPEGKACAAKSVGSAIVEFRLGHEAVALARSKLTGPPNRTARQIFLALAARVPDPSGRTVLINNPYRNWNQIEGVAEDQRIEFVGPDLAAVAGEAFVSVMVEKGCDSFAWLAALRVSDPKQHAGICRTVREDGVYAELGASYPAAIANRLEGDPAVVGVLGLESYDGFVGAGRQLDLGAVDGVRLSRASVASGAYPASRALYMYVNVNTEHVRTVRDLAPFVRSEPFTFWTTESQDVVLRLDREQGQALQQSLKNFGNPDWRRP